MSTPVRCLRCGWQTVRIRSGEAHGYGTCNKCGEPMDLLGTARALRRLNGVRKDFADWGLAIPDRTAQSKRIH